MGRPNTTFRRLREEEWQMGRREAAEFLVKKSIEHGDPVHCVTRTIATWEDGTTACPSPAYRRLLHKLTGRTVTQLGFTLPTPRTARTTENEDDMRRRTMLLGTSAALLTATAPSTITGSGPALGAEHLQQLHDAELTLYAHDRNHGSAELGRQAAAALDTAHTWLRHGRYSEHLGRRLHCATGNLSVAAGWLALDAGRPHDARSLYTEALANARHADDPGLEAHAFACLSLLAHATGRPREAVTTAQVAQRAAAPLGSPRWQSLLAMREARGWALQGDRTLTEQALIRVHNLYAQGPRDNDPDWLTFYVPAELAGLESLCRADLGQYERASAGAEQAVMLFGDGHLRNRALYTADIALHHARKKNPDLDAATEAAHRTSPTSPTSTPTASHAPCATSPEPSSPTTAPARSTPSWTPTAPPYPPPEGPPVTDTLTLRRYGAGDVPLLLDTLVDTWADAHADHPDVTDAGFTPDALRRQITSHARREDFTLIAAYADGHLVGFGYGFLCTPAYWYGEELLPHITPDSARTTDALAGICELAVRPGWQGRGAGTGIHQALIDALQPEWASLLAMPGAPAQDLYRRLGYRNAGPYQAAPGGPVMDLLLFRARAAE
ncbi:N-acetyltransferase family protein [Streptomyces sp. 12297]